MWKRILKSSRKLIPLQMLRWLHAYTLLSGYSLLLRSAGSVLKSCLSCIQTAVKVLYLSLTKNSQ